MILSASNVEDLISKIREAAALMEEQEQEQEPLPAKELDLVDVAIRTKITALVVENCGWDDNADLKDTLETVYNFVTG